MNNKRFISSIIEIAIGVVLLIVGGLQIIDIFWTGMGTALIMVGSIYLIRQFCYKTNTDYKEKYDTEVKDERNRFLSMKAWSWAGYLFVIIAAVTTIALKIAGFEELMLVTSGSVCLITLLYWIAYLILRKKY